MTVLNKNSHLALFCSTYFRTYLFLQLFKNKHCLFTIIERNRATQNKTRIIKKAGQFVFKSVTLACQHLYSCFFFSVFQLVVLEKHINVPSYRGLCRALEITPGRTETTNNPLDLFTLDIYSCISYCLLIHQPMVTSCTCRYLSDSGYPVDSQDLIFLFLHLISKHGWLHSHKIL